MDFSYRSWIEEKNASIMQFLKKSIMIPMLRWKLTQTASSDKNALVNDYPSAFFFAK